MKVLKFGGTSVGKPERMSQVREIITKDSDDKIVVLSAVSGTTNSLVQIGECLYNKNRSKAQSLVEALKESYYEFIKELYTEEKYHTAGKEIVEKQFAVIAEMLDKDFTYVEERLLLAQGELLSTQMFVQYLKQERIDAELLWALDFMSIDEHNEPDLTAITSNIAKVLKKAPKASIYITQGFICINPANEVDNLKRGGSDYTASLIGAAIMAEEVQIWTDIDGMHNNDPRVVSKTRPIENLSFDEAAELAYFGAKILHPATIIPAAKKEIPVKLLNTMQPNAKGTVISNKTVVKEIKAVAAKDNITAIKIKSSRMLMAYGFLRKIFEIFEKYRTPIDMVTTSEIAVSVTIDNETHLRSIVEELSEFGQVEVDSDLSIVCVAGQGIAEINEPGIKILTALRNVPIRMISYGGSKNNISVLIKSEHKVEALQSLNTELFNL